MCIIDDAPSFKALCMSIIEKARSIGRFWRVAVTTISNYMGVAKEYKRNGDDRARQMYWMMRWGKQMVVDMGIDIDLHGQAHEGVVLYVVNHRSYADIPIVLSQIPTFMLAKHEITNWPVVGGGAKSAGAVFVKRDKKTSRRNAAEAISQRLQEGHPVLLFPEGTTVKGEIKSFSPRSFQIAAKLGVPVVPVALEYHHEDMAWVGGSDFSFVTHFLKHYGERRSKVRLSIGPKITDDDPVRLMKRARQFILDEAIVPT